MHSGSGNEHMLDKHMPMAHILTVVEVVGTDEFSDWFHDLGDSDQDAVARVVEPLLRLVDVAWRGMSVGKFGDHGACVVR